MEEFDPAIEIAAQHEQARSDQAKRRLIQFGIDVDRWFQTPIGRYCVDKAAKEENELLEELAEVDANDVKEIIRLQTQIQVRRAWQGWLSEAISEGRTAEAQAIEQGHL